MRVAGIQPGYLPWLGYFDQIRRVDAFIVADEMQFSSSGWAHHNRVRGPHGAYWLTLPARPRRGQRICEVELDASVDWREQHLRTLRHFYARSPFAAPLLDEMAAVMDARATRLIDATMPILHWLAAQFGLATPLLLSSQLGLEARYAERFPDRPGPTHRIIAFLQTLGATQLLEGASGADYLDVALCAEHGIAVEFQHYAHPVYQQCFAPFVSHLAALDLLLCAGPHEARRVLAGAA